MAPYNLRKQPKNKKQQRTPESVKADQQPVMESDAQEVNRVATTPNPVTLDEDDSDSDVSASPSDIENSSHVQQSPTGQEHESTPASDIKSLLEAGDLSAMKQRIAELEVMEDTLARKRNRLIAKRKRKDQKIKTRREGEDERIKRQREQEDALRLQKRIAKDDRIRKRREKEDADYWKKANANDEEEYELRRKLKDLKRGRPDEEITQPRSAGTVSESMSPPAKKHQPHPPSIQPLKSPPGPVAIESQQQQHHPQQQQQQKQPHNQQQPYQQQRQPPHQQQQHHQQPRQPSPPRYPYHWGYPPPPNGPYAYGPGQTYHSHNLPHPPQQESLPPPQIPNGGPPRFKAPPPPPPPPPREGPSPNPKPASPHPQHFHHHTQAPHTSTGSAHYDVRPPSTGANFTSINAAPSGFQPINQPPTPGVRTPVQSAPKAKRSAKSQALALGSSAHNSPTHPPGSSPSNATPALSGKRKASTTHPYSQSEAFANRHHHCERVDELDRGIWTYFGPGGTKEAPTVAGKKEMYLRCDHDGCMRLDWKTVHGLQCHIVKSHGVTKGTIGSLELALERYGVEVQEVEDHEKKHGLGSAGTIAEKGTRPKARPRISNEMTRSEFSGPSPTPPNGAVAAPTTKVASSARSKPSGPPILFPNLTSKGPSGGYVQDDIVYSEDESDGDQSSVEVKQAPHRKIAGAAHWRASDSDLSTPPAPKSGRNDEQHEPMPHSAPAQQGQPYISDSIKSPEPRPPSSTQTLAIADSAPTSTGNLPPPPTPTASKLPLHSAPQTQDPPMGTETQKIVSAVERVNARLEAEDSDFEATSTASDLPSQTQQTQTQTQTQTQPKSNDTSTAASSTTTGNTNTITKNQSTSRPRSGVERERRVPASERWEWAPLESDDEENDRLTTTTKKRDSSTTTLTKAQQELQGFDGVGERDGDEGAGGDGGAGTGRSPVQGRYSARKKTRRRFDG